ncbi:hypothetical protein C0989_008695 [Termitomyces sp. Mn162]|nr:hypothetical protein C0989_008695 [Termitomyces sp. Mn162]
MSATESLRLTHAACQAALQSLDVPSSPPQNPPDLPTLRTDFISLLSLIYAATTKLSLALKPSSPTYSASIIPLQDISDKVTALCHCVRLFGPKHGSTLTREIISVARDLIVSVKALLQTFLDAEEIQRARSTGKAGDEYLVRTGAVHEIINHARSGLSHDNAAAVQKVLAQNHASLDDGLQEVDGMITTQSSADNAPAGDWEDDGWSELGMDSRTPMTSEELERTKKVHAMLRLSTLLHDRIIRNVLTVSAGPQLDLSSRFVKSLDSLPPHSSSLVVASDDLVSTLYTPQTPSEITAELAAFIKVIENLRSTLLELLQEPDLADQMQAMNLQTSTSYQRDPKKWFQTCFAQIQKAADSLESVLNTHE